MNQYASYLLSKQNVIHMDDINNNNPQLPKGVRLWFGIFMVLIYLGVGLMFILDIFKISNTSISTAVGIILAIYGIWRGYRLYKGWN